MKINTRYWSIKYDGHLTGSLEVVWFSHILPSQNMASYKSVVKKFEVKL
jgi:hypothetical protein